MPLNRIRAGLYSPAGAAPSGGGTDTSHSKLELEAERNGAPQLRLLHSLEAAFITSAGTARPS